MRREIIQVLGPHQNVMTQSILLCCLSIMRFLDCLTEHVRECDRLAAELYKVYQANLTISSLIAI